VSRRRPAPDPFAALGLAARPDLTDDDVRAAWRRVAAATHPDRADGGDPARFAAAAAAYTELRTRFGRGEAMADARSAGSPGRRPGGTWFRRRSTRGTGRRRGMTGTGHGARVPGGPALATEGSVNTGSSRRLAAAAGRLAARIRRGRPGRLALRVLAAAAASAAAMAAAGSGPAGPALVTGVLTWLVLTARQDLAPPPG
jgi:curved DNA-binding protein CbpA